MNARCQKTKELQQAADEMAQAAEVHSARREESQRNFYEHLIKAGKIPAKDFNLLTRVVNDRLAIKGLDSSEDKVCPVFADIGSAWSGEMSPEKPSASEVLPGKFMLYRGRMNEQHGEPGIGKSNVSLLFAMQEIHAGRDVIYIDPEDSVFGICRRLAALGAKRESVVKHLHYINPSVDQLWKLQLWAFHCRPSLVILDGLSRAMMLDDKDEDRAKEVLEFISAHVRPFLFSEAAVLISDHVTKSKDSRGRHSRGSGAKLGEWDGVSYEVDLIKAYTPTQAGALSLKICKDRNGGVGQIGEVALEIHFSPGEDGITKHEFVVPSKKEFKPTQCMEKVSRFLEINPDAGSKDVRDMGGFQAQRIDQAIRHLEEAGFIKKESGGPRNKTRFKVLRPYREPQEEPRGNESGDQS
jgi:hypothetical protein